MGKNKKKVNNSHSPEDKLKVVLDAETSRDDIEADDVNKTLDSENSNDGETWDIADGSGEAKTSDEASTSTSTSTSTSVGASDETGDEVNNGQQDEVSPEPDGGEGAVLKKAKVRDKTILIDKTHTRRLYLTLFAALIGASFAMIPVVLCTYWFGTVFYPFFIIAPLLIYVLNILFDGCGDIRALAISAVLSLISAFVSILACQVLILVSYYGYSIASLPASFYVALNESGVFPKSASMYVYPLLFTALGLTAIWELMRFDLRKRVTA